MGSQFRFEVITDPVAKARPRVALRGGKAHAYTPAKTQEAEWRIRTAFCDQFPRHEPLSGPVELHVIAWLKMPASVPKKRRHEALPVTRPDADNYLKTVLDALNGVAFVDDSQVITTLCSKLYAKDNQPPAWSITVSDLSPRHSSQSAAAAHIPAQENEHLKEGEASTVNSAR